MMVMVYDADEFIHQKTDLKKANYIGEATFILHEIISKRDK